MTDRFHCAQRWVMYLQGDQAKTKTSWQAFVEILRRHTEYLPAVLTTTLRRRMAKELPELWRMFGFVVLAVDGTDIAVPLTLSIETAFSAKKTPANACNCG